MAGAGDVRACAVRYSGCVGIGFGLGLVRDGMGWDDGWLGMDYGAGAAWDSLE